MTLSKAAVLLKAIANIKRLEILLYLSHDELSVGDLEQKLDLTQSALSQHLAVLREAEIVQTRRYRQKIFYRLENPLIKKILKLLTKD
ncbi:MAG TPA: ArsR family transcriptional regulator [Alphaproteobacteria bacterium]|nr:ArsR family transcriptional regulator [Alphaproteobacteria bacterium]